MRLLCANEGDYEPLNEKMDYGRRKEERSVVAVMFVWMVKIAYVLERLNGI